MRALLVPLLAALLTACPAVKEEEPKKVTIPERPPGPSTTLLASSSSDASRANKADAQPASHAMSETDIFDDVPIQDPGIPVFVQHQYTCSACGAPAPRITRSRNCSCLTT